MAARRVSLGEPVPGYDQGRPLPPGREGESEARQALRRAWLGRFMVEGDALHQDGLVVLRDLSRYCDALRTTAKSDGAGRCDPYAMAIAEGRRQAFLFVLSRLGLAASDILMSIERSET